MEISQGVFKIQQSHTPDPRNKVSYLMTGYDIDLRNIHQNLLSVSFQFKNMVPKKRGKKKKKLAFSLLPFKVAGIKSQ